MMKMLLPWFFMFLVHVAVSQTRYMDEIFDEVVRTTFTYAEKDGESLELDVYTPRSDTATKRPVLIWMHGGGFAGGSRRNGAEVRLMETMARRGYVAVSLSYRLLRKGEPTGFSCDCPRAEKIRVFRAAATDFWDAIKFMYDRADAFAMDRDRIIVGGSSAGAEAMLHAVYMKDWLYEPVNPYSGIKLAGAWSLAGAVTDVRYLNADNAVPTACFHGTDDNLVPYATAPHHYCDSDKPGYIILDGAKSISEALEKHDASYLLYTVIGGRHELAGIPFDQLDLVLDFFYNTVIANDQLIQMHKIVQRASND